MNAPRKYRIALIEPSDIVCTGVKALLAPQSGFEVVATVSDLRQWAAFPKASSVDILLVDPSVADRHDRQNMRQTLQAGTDNILTALIYHYCHQEELSQYDCVLDIADPKDTMVKKLQQAIRNRHQPAQPSGRDNAELSEREKEILTCLVAGHTNKEIAAIYNLSVHTVISHRKNISRKTGIKTVSGLTVYALLNRLINPQDVEQVAACRE